MLAWLNGRAADLSDECGSSTLAAMGRYDPYRRRDKCNSYIWLQ